jgi:hypothetical protein
MLNSGISWSSQNSSQLAQMRDGIRRFVVESSDTVAVPANGAGGYHAQNG